MKLMTEKELTQLAKTLSEQLEAQLRSYRPDSPELIGHVLSIADELTTMIEVAFDEAACLADDEENQKRKTWAHQQRLFGGL